MQRKIYVWPINTYSKNPDVYQKNSVNPFPSISATWVVWFFRHVTPRKRIRFYSSYGRTPEEAAKGLNKSMHKNMKLENISHELFLKLKRRKK